MIMAAHLVVSLAVVAVTVNRWLAWRRTSKAPLGWLFAASLAMFISGALDSQWGYRSAAAIIGPIWTHAVSHELALAAAMCLACFGTYYANMPIRIVHRFIRLGCTMGATVAAVLAVDAAIIQQHTAPERAWRVLLPNNADLAGVGLFLVVQSLAIGAGLGGMLLVFAAHFTRARQRRMRWGLALFNLGVVLVIAYAAHKVYRVANDDGSEQTARLVLLPGLAAMSVGVAFPSLVGIRDRWHQRRINRRALHDIQPLWQALSMVAPPRPIPKMAIWTLAARLNQVTTHIRDTMTYLAAWIPHRPEPTPAAYAAAIHHALQARDTGQPRNLDPPHLIDGSDDFNVEVAWMADLAKHFQAMSHTCTNLAVESQNRHNTEPCDIPQQTVRAQWS